MATKIHETGFLLILALTLCRGATAQSQPGCSNTLGSLSSCMSYITGNSSRPLQSCCSSLATVVRSQPGCLCSLLSNGAGASLGIAINRTLALALPATCNVQTPPASRCNDVANGPAGVPALSPLSPPTDDDYSDSPESPAATTSPSVPSGSNTVPKTTESTSAASTVTTSIYLGFVTLFVTACIINKFHF